MIGRLLAATSTCVLVAACGGGSDLTPESEDGNATSRIASALPTAGSGPDGTLPSEVLVKLRAAGDLPGILATHRLTRISAFGARPIYRLRLNSGTQIEATVQALRNDPRVLIAEPNARASAPEARRGAVWAIGDPSAYTAQWAPEAIALAAAHQISQGAGVRVAVLDTGVDASHPALASRLLPGRDFVDADNLPAEEGGPDRPGWGHGTHTAGLVALTAPAARIVPLRVLDADGRGNVWVVAEALLHAADPDRVGATDDGAHIINLSLGTTRPTRILDAVIELVTCSDDDDDEDDDDYSDPGYDQDKQRCDTSHGSVIVSAAGNGASATERQYPAAEPAEGALSVAASTSASTLAAFSNRGPWIQIAAPGEGITSAVPGGGYGVWSGTSMATPLTAGVAALVVSRNPDWKPVDVTKRLLDRSARLCGTSLRRIDANGAVRDFVPPDMTCRR